MLYQTSASTSTGHHSELCIAVNFAIDGLPRRHYASTEVLLAGIKIATESVKFRFQGMLQRVVVNTSASDSAEARILLLPAALPRNGKLPVLNLLTGQKSGFSPRRVDSLHRFTSNLAWLTCTWVRLAEQNFTSIGAGGWECGGFGPKISKISTFW